MRIWIIITVRLKRGYCLDLCNDEKQIQFLQSPLTSYDNRIVIKYKLSLIIIYKIKDNMADSIEIINILMVLLSPVIAVVIGQHLQNRSELRKDKIEIFQCLMKNRVYYWGTKESVDALNRIDVVFYNSNNVIQAWKHYYNKIQIENHTDIKLVIDLQYELLSEMAKDLGYGAITKETLYFPYRPDGVLKEDCVHDAYNQVIMYLINNLADKKDDTK